MWAQVSVVLSQSMRLTDGRRDRQTALSWLYCALHYRKKQTTAVVASLPYDDMMPTRNNRTAATDTSLSSRQDVMSHNSD